MAVGQTLENCSKTLENRKTLGDEILQLDENPVIKSDELENPSRNFDEYERILSGPVSEIKTLDEEILPLHGNPEIKSVALKNPSRNVDNSGCILSGSVSEIKTLDEEILPLHGNQEIKSVALENPSRNFDDSGGILSGSVLEIKTLSEEEFKLDENLDIRSDELKNPSRNFDDSCGILSGSVSEIKTVGEENLRLDENSDIEIVKLGNISRNLDESEGILSGSILEIKTVSEENLKLDESPDIKSVEVENPSRNFDESCGSFSGWISEIDDLDEDMLKGSVVFYNSFMDYPSSDVNVAEVTKTLGFGGIMRTIEFETSVLSCDKVDEVMGVLSEGGLLKNPVADCCETGGDVGGSVVVCDAQVAKVVDEINKTMQVENTVSVCCEMGKTVGSFSMNDDALVAKSLDEIPETMLLENLVSDCSGTGGIMSSISGKVNTQVAKSLEILETVQSENPISDCCEKGGIVGDYDLVARTLEETTQYSKTLNEFIQDGVPKIRDVQSGKALEDCNTDKGEKFDDDKLDEVVSGDYLFSDDDNDKELFSADELYGKSISHGSGCGAYGNADSKFSGIGWPLSQYRRKQCDCGRCSDGPQNPYSHPYFSDPHMFPYYGDHDYFRCDPHMFPYKGDRPNFLRHRKGSKSERIHQARMNTEPGYRLYHENMGRSVRPDCMEEDTEGYPFYDRGFMNRRHGFMDRESRSSFNSIGRYHEPEPESFPVGAGLLNLGNTCFLNAIIQCFTHIVPLVEGLQSLKHDASSHGQDEFCVLCAVRLQIERSLIFSGKSISPTNLVDNLKYISSDFRRYQQEDAHDFLMSLFDKLDSNWSKHEANLGEVSSSPDSLVKQLFGGRLVSQLHCCECGHNSDSYEPMIDLSLEIEDVDNLESALKSFTKVENLQDTEKIRCDGCKETVLAQKQLLLDQAPPVAALHLKRFKSDGFRIEKIDRKIEYPLELDFNPYTKGAIENDEALKYELYGFVVHVGYTPISGHYFCYIRTSPDTWYQFDDSEVTKVSEFTALDQDAYILFYARKGTPWFSDLLDKWKANLEEKSNPSPNSVLNSTNLPSTSLNLGDAPHGCQDSDKTDTDSITSAPPISVSRPDDVDKESTVPANTSCLTASSEPIYDEVSANKAEVDVQVEVTAGEVTKLETCSIVSDVVNTSVVDNIVDTNPFISLEPGNSDMCSDKEKHAAEEVKEKMSLSMTNRLRRTKQVSPRKEAPKYPKLSTMAGGRCKILMAGLSKRRKVPSLLHRHCPS